jgi:Kef-type K+ transport system membrane component KefB/nucleotide-binding universal stress UspA family protein
LPPVAAFFMLFAFCAPGIAFCAEHAKESTSESLFIIQIVVLVVVGRLFGEVMVRMGQPSIMGQILAGIFLGPSILGAIWPDAHTLLFPEHEAQKAMTDAVGQIGILLLLLLAGMETDLALAVRLRRAAAGVSLMGIVIPFSAGFALGELLPSNFLPDPDSRLVTSLFLGTALSISSVKIVASVVREMNFMRRNTGQMIVASAIIDDTIGWVIIAMTFSLASSGTLDWMSVAKSVAGTLIFMAFSFTIGRRMVFEIIRWTNDNFKSELPVLSAIIAIMGGMAILTNLIGVHTVLGAFVAGILIGESPILTRQIDVQIRGLTTALFMPVFFGLTGLKTDLSVLLDPSTLLLAGGVILIASLGKFGGAFAGAKISGYTNAEAFALGCGMNARGSTEVIVASIGLAAGALDQRLFSVIVAMAVVTTLAMPPTLRFALARLPLRSDERERLAQEHFEDTSFLSKFERILLAADASENSRLAARIAAFFASVRGTPISVLDVEAARKPGEKNDETEKAKETEAAPDGAKRLTTEIETYAGKILRDDENGEDGFEPKPVHVTTSAMDGDLAELLNKNAEKGHDLLFSGVTPITDSRGGFGDLISLMTSAFKGTAVIISSRGIVPESNKALKILVPVSGTERSTRAAEFASVLARAAGAKMSVIFVEENQKATSRPRLSDAPNLHEDTFRKIDEISRFHGVEVTKLVHEGASPELAILRRARRERFNLIVMGVSRREGDRLSYGGIADTLMETSGVSLVLVETG